MTTTEPERRYFQNVDGIHITSASAPEHIDHYLKSHNYREVLIAPIPEIEVSEPNMDGIRRAHVGARTVGWVGYRDISADYWRDVRDYRMRRAGEAEAAARWIEAHPEPDPESVARVQAVRDALAMLTDDERAEALR